MIKQIVLDNFQSHERTVIDCNDGVNIVVGSSRSGKTAVLRGFRWCRYNRPAGTSFVSYWNRDKDGSPVDSTSVTVVFDNGVEIKRFRSATDNGYEIKRPGQNTELLLAIGQKVPEVVEDLFNISEVNLQSQFDQPFMLSESNAEVARFFNKTIRLDLIDTILSNAENKRRKNNQAIDGLTEEIDDLGGEIGNMDYLDTAETIIAKADKMQDQIQSLVYDAELLEKELMLAVKLKDNLSSYPENVVMENILFEAQGVMVKISEIEKQSEKARELADIIGKYKTYDKTLADYEEYDFTGMECLIKKASALVVRIGSNEKDILDLEHLEFNLHKHSKDVFIYGNLVESFVKMLPNVCPTCGRPMEVK